jgi:hypothetical protein
MALTPNFTVLQNSGTPSYLNFTDTSTGSDGSIVSRRIYMLQSDGTYLVPDGTTTDYVVWSLASATISLDVLSQDAALTITVNWVDVSGNAVEDKTTTYGFTAYSETFYYGLSQSEVPITNPNVATSTNYYQNKMLLRVFIDSADQAVSFASDIYSAQVALDSAAFLIANANFNF